MDLSTVAAVICDMDGVLWRGDEALPGLAAFFAMLHARGLPYILATNNSSKTPGDYVQKLARMNVEGIRESAIITSGTATVGYLQMHYPPGSAVHVLGGPGLKQLIDAAGYARVDGAADVVVVGVDFDLTYDKLRRAVLAIRAGADFVGTNPDTTFPTPEGLVPGAGSILAALQAATDQTPVVIGKPHRPMFEIALRQLGSAAENTLMIGDRLQTDILGGQEAGLRTALLLTGVATREEAQNGSIRPDAVFVDLPDLLAGWNA